MPPLLLSLSVICTKVDNYFSCKRGPRQKFLPVTKLYAFNPRFSLFPHKYLSYL